MLQNGEVEETNKQFKEKKYTELGKRNYLGTRSLSRGEVELQWSIKQWLVLGHIAIHLEL